MKHIRTLSVILAFALVLTGTAFAAPVNGADSFAGKREILNSKITETAVTSVAESKTEEYKTSIYTDVEPCTTECYVSTLAAELGICNGYADGTFRPWRHISRAEFIVSFMRTLDIEPTSDNPAIFTTQPSGHWASAWIETARALDMLTPLSTTMADGTAGKQIAERPLDPLIRPDRDITLAEVCAMVLMQVPYQDDLSYYDLAVSVNLDPVDVARDIGLLEGVYIYDTEDPVDRVSAARILINTIYRLPECKAD